MKILLAGLVLFSAILIAYSLTLDVQELEPETFPPRCIDTYPQLEGIIREASGVYNIPEELIAAIITAESSWDDNGYRYEPVFQVRFFENTPKWRNDPAWLEQGPTIGQWLEMNPERQDEADLLTEAELGLVAQTRISASYGLMQVLYTSAEGACGFQGRPEQLYDIYTNVDCGTQALRKLLDTYSQDLTEAVSAYNAGTPEWRRNPQNRGYTERVIGYYNAYLACPEG